MLHRQLGFSAPLCRKIDGLIAFNQTTNIGKVEFQSPLLLAPMSGISTPPFRLFLEALGAGGTVSELVSCHGIIHGNERTRKMLMIDQREKSVGLQLFGEDPSVMAEGAKVAQDNNPKFIDINMGCPVRKVVSKGSGSALLKDPSKLGHFFKTIKNAITLPLTIKIRTGWDQETRNAPEVMRIASLEGIEWVAIHGRTRAQAYQGLADWDYIHWAASQSALPTIGNGDLNTADHIRQHLKATTCRGLMLGRGPLRDPFLFLKVNDVKNEFKFTPQDYGEAVQVLAQLLMAHARNEKEALTNIKKHTVWMSNGLAHSGKFRQDIFASGGIDDALKMSNHFFNEQDPERFEMVLEQNFMQGGHG